ncbi:RNA methyltransferase [Rhodocytophaga rosea]|uniref:RNA methyltransferase n=1 Tax=Rhodocytophaga rosea TaxID=2704465 RepID=A0A6C0GVQ0_9BACT|nr:RNA methyltransferase [Rhodocytophaga rosea]QHT71402.1 RNA methyltransferase [Rhodocytophaga rosea]
MISKKWLKLIHSLQVKKYRKLHQAFLVEGAKSVQELLSSDYQITVLFTTQEFYNENIRLLSRQSFELQILTQEELEKTGVFQSNNACLAVVVSKPNLPLSVTSNEYALILDEIKDPGNLGTIIRIADWYGITKIICSESTTDFYNPKVIAASMGSFTRVQLYYCNLHEYLQHTANLQVYGAYLNGIDVHTVSFASSGLIVMGNESQGISQALEPLIKQKIHIPRYGGAESLNVGIATAVICDNLRRAVGND